MVDAVGKLDEIRFDTVEEYLDWAMEQSGRFELEDGRPVAMSPERVGHARTKFRTAMALHKAVEDAGVPCEVLPDGLTVQTASDTAFEPDAIVHCATLDENSVIADAPIILVEVISPSSQSIDTIRKLSGYFTIPSVIHYLILDTEKRLVIHHERKGERIETRFVSEGALTLDPPGLTVPVEAMFAPEE
jgi:Uma2 family endonuclease